MGEIVQPCNFITGYFSQPRDSIKWTSSEEKGSNNQTRPCSCQFLKVKTAVCLETYHRFRFGVSHQTGEEILLVDLIDNMSVISHRYRHFLHHLGKVSARSTERDRWASRNEGGREEERADKSAETGTSRQVSLWMRASPLRREINSEGMDHTRNTLSLWFCLPRIVYPAQFLQRDKALWIAKLWRLLSPRSHG